MFVRDLSIFVLHHVANTVRKGIHFYTSLNEALGAVFARASKFVTDRRSEGADLFKTLEAEKPTRDQERLREDLNRLTLNYATQPPPPVPPQPGRRTSMPAPRGYPYPPSQPQTPYVYSQPPVQQLPQSHVASPPHPQSPQGYAPPQNSYGYSALPPQGQRPPPLHPKPTPLTYRGPQFSVGYPPPAPPPPPPPPSSGQGPSQRAYGNRPSY